MNNIKTTIEEQFQEWIAELTKIETPDYKSKILNNSAKLRLLRMKYQLLNKLKLNEQEHQK
jgi:hypothetical protein